MSDAKKSPAAAEQPLCHRAETQAAADGQAHGSRHEHSHCSPQEHDHVHEACPLHEHDHGHTHKPCAPHEHTHEHVHDHPHAPEHDQPHAHPSHAAPAAGGTVLTLRAHSGISGDMFLAGLLRMTELDAAGTEEVLCAIMPELSGSVRLVRAEVRGIGGWHAAVSLPHQHAHRTLADILAVIRAGGMQPAAQQRAAETFTLLARAEAAVHGKNPDDVQFHEVGALDSILDICMTCELFTRLAPARFVASPLPMADGCVRCAHGIIPVPAPAVLELLEGIPVRPFSGTGETVTPTGMALLRSLGAEFGPWPAMRVAKKALVYGSTVFEDAPNGAIFACGTAL